MFGPFLREPLKSLIILPLYAEAHRLKDFIGEEKRRTKDFLSSRYTFRQRIRGDTKSFKMVFFVYDLRAQKEDTVLTSCNLTS